MSAAGSYRQRRNLDAIEARGIELDARWDLAAFWLSASYAYVDARVQAAGAAAPLDATRPAQTAPHQGSATLGWRRGDARASLTARYVAPQFEDDRNAQRLASAITLDGSARLPLGKGLAIEARAENVFDARVEAGIAGAGAVERATPRTFWIGLRYGLR